MCVCHVHRQDSRPLFPRRPNVSRASCWLRGVGHGIGGGGGGGEGDPTRFIVEVNLTCDSMRATFLVQDFTSTLTVRYINYNNWML